MQRVQSFLWRVATLLGAAPFPRAEREIGVRQNHAIYRPHTGEGKFDSGVGGILLACIGILFPSQREGSLQVKI